MMDHDRAFSASGSSADAAAIAVSSEHLLPQTAEICLILPLERVARGTHAQRENFPPSATAVECPLNTNTNLLHFPLPFQLLTSPGRYQGDGPYNPILTSLRRQGAQLRGMREAVGLRSPTASLCRPRYISGRVKRE